MAGTLSRFFKSASSSGAFASIYNNVQLLQTSQKLYDQILPSAATIGVDESNTRSKESEPDKIWALVAIVATGMTQEIKLEQAETEQELTDSKTTLNWHLVQLLAEADVGLQEFLLYLTSLFNRLLLEPELITATTLLKEDFTIATLLFEKYRMLWEKFVPKSKKSLSTSDPEPESDDSQQREQKACTRHQNLFESGWLLFILAKRRLGAHYSGLGQLYNLLLATLHLVIANAQASQATIEMEVAAALSAMGALGADNASPLKTAAGVKTSAQICEALCSVPKVNSTDVFRASEHLGLVLVQLREENVLQIEAGKQPILSMTLFADNVLEANVTRLYERYEKDYLDGCGKLDERFYLDKRIRCIIMGRNGAHKENEHDSLSLCGTESNGNCSTSRSAILSPVRRNMHARRQEKKNGIGSSISMTRGVMTPPRHRQLPYGTNSPLIHSWQWQGSPRNVRLIAPSLSPCPSPSSIQSPVTTAVEINNLVREVLSSTMLTPVTPQLRQFFADCVVDPTERITRVLNEHSDLLLAARNASQVTSGNVPSTATMVLDFEQDSTTNEIGSEKNAFSSSGLDDTLKRIKNLTIVLFYRVLEPLLLSERKRLRTTDFSKLLNNEVFLAALFACSAEVVLKAHSLITISYPFLLEHLHVNVFHFVTTSESFVKYAPKLPSALKKHMSDVKNHILDSVVWKSSSALYQLLPQSKDRSSDLNTSCMTDSSNKVAPIAYAPVLRLFFRMVFSRAASRIYQYCNLLNLDATDQSHIWTVVKECISSHQYLLQNRHLDLIVLCSIYGVCKVSRGPNVSKAAATVSFKKLLACHKQLSRQTSTDSKSIVGTQFVSSRTGEGVTYGIPLENASLKGDIIKFYNRCFITPMKVFILQFQCHESQMAAADAIVANASSASQALPPGFMIRREGTMGLTALTSDAESISCAASDAVRKFFEPQIPSTGTIHDTSKFAPSTPPHSLHRQSSPFLYSPAATALQMFTTAEVQTLPVSIYQTSPMRVKSSNIFMSPLQQVRLDRRSDLTPRSHALYAIGESPARNLALINRAVNTAPANLRRVRAPNLVMDSDTEQDSTRVCKKQKSAM
ncbi:putative retinoblastoma protein family [Plasmopara halstedii]